MLLKKCVKVREGWETGNKNNSCKLISLTKFLPVTFPKSYMILLEKQSKSYFRLYNSWGVSVTFTQNAEVLSLKSLLSFH